MTVDSPLGTLSLATDDRGRLTRLSFGSLPAGGVTPAAARVAAQLRDYFAGRRQTFEVELAPHGTPFQLAVWEELCRIPYGQTITYAELARRIGKPNAVRAVGAANGANPIAIIVPCHRVIGTNGKLTGYGGGVHNKQWLLALEGRRLF